MRRRDLLKAAAAAPLVRAAIGLGSALAPALPADARGTYTRARPGTPAWPTVADWERLGRDTGGRLLNLEPPFAGCGVDTRDATCTGTLAQLQNPFFVGDQPALTQTSGWVDAWTSVPSVYAIAAESTADVVAAVNFAREHRLRLVIKGGGHSYLGTSCAPDSLLVWTRRMNRVSVEEAFVAQGCSATTAPQPAVSVGAGAMWIDAYDAVTTRGGRYVQGGGCTTVGVAGLVQGGGFGSHSKGYGTAAAGLLEAEVVTANGDVLIANACTHPDLFWALKGGGGGSFGVVTRLTLRTRALPEFFGGIFGEIKASTDGAYRELIAKVIAFYARDLFNPHWGEQLVFKSENTLKLSMVFQGVTQQQADATWAPFLDWVREHNEYSFAGDVRTLSLPAQHFWDPDVLAAHAPGATVRDDRADAPHHHMLWAGDQGQVAQFLHGYQSAWLPAALLDERSQARLADAVFACTRHWQMAFHFNKGLAGAAAPDIAAARDTAMNPAVLDAFALAIIAAEGPPAFPGMPGPKPDLAIARADAKAIAAAMHELLRVAPAAGSYVNETDFFQRDWQSAFWGANYTRLSRVKRKYDRKGLFIVHHGVGSEEWSEDGFTRLWG